MAKYAISAEGAAALRQAAQNLLSGADSILDSARTMRNSIREYQGELGVYGEIIQSLSEAAANRIGQNRDEIVALARQLLQKAADVERLVARLQAEEPGSGTEAGPSGEGGKALKMTAEERERRGIANINEYVGILRDDMIDKGVTSVAALDRICDELRAYYRQELAKDIAGQPNNLNTPPDLEALAERAGQYRDPLAGVMPGEAMSFRDADSGHVNPHYGEEKGYSTNCQSCVVVFEARLRGYNADVLPNTAGSALETLSRDPRLAWIDPWTGKPPEYICDNTLSTPEAYADYIDRTVQAGGRYTIQFAWKGRSAGGHIVNLDRDGNGQLRIKDNQRGPGERDTWTGKDEIIRYLSRVKIIPGSSGNGVPRMLRIDGMDFNHRLADRIMRRS